MTNIRLQRIPLTKAGFSHADVSALEFLLNSKEIPWLRITKEGLLEFIVDNHLLSTYRKCPQYFFFSMVEGLSLNGGTSPWFLDFGIWFHKMIEYYYRDFRKPEFELAHWCTMEAQSLWASMDMEKHSQHKEFNSMKGVIGAQILLAQYSNHFGKENERLRIIAQEIAFGKNREVPILTKDLKLEGYSHFRAYLSGRIDLLVDDGFYISPMDHKTVAEVKSDTSKKHRLDEGPTGYVYAVSKLLPQVIPPDMVLKRKCNQIMMNYIGKKIPSSGNMGDRFSRMAIFKSKEQLEEYRVRMILTCDSLLRALVYYLRTNISIKDTSRCESWMFNECMFNQVCRQNSEDNRKQIKNAFYQIKPIWDTENRKEED